MKQCVRVFATILLSGWLVYPNFASSQQQAPRRSTDSRISGSFSYLMEKVGPSVVRISYYVETASGDQVQRTTTGFIVDGRAGLIVTNAHAMESNSGLNVEFVGGRTSEAVLVGKDDRHDIALLRVNDSGLRAIEFGDFTNLRVGDLAFAIGFPQGMEQTLSMGIVSGISRRSLNNTLSNFIQTDAFIYRGNGGGPLIDDQGKLLGINTAVFSRTDGVPSGGFAIPVSTIAVVVSYLKKGEQAP